MNREKLFEQLGFSWDDPFNIGEFRITDKEGGVHMANVWESRLINAIEGMIK